MHTYKAALRIARSLGGGLLRSLPVEYCEVLDPIRHVVVRPAVLD
jgi:hypothetical protein